ncbi:unnamed protein product [Orchesella dallaii]|uniref:Elongation of very long chain fatty acids protein n=1 Tax=Orchesella dallaii TaxID=48710 RepID=A0ABP1QWW8_9HEXA
MAFSIMDGNTSLVGMNSTENFLVPWEYENPARFTPFWFEKHDNDFWRNLFKEYDTFPLYVCAVYLTLVFGIQHLMKDRAPFKLRKPLAVWNFGLGIFSILGFYRTYQELIRIFSMPDGIHRSLCYREMLNEPASFWGIAFTLSKIVELGDTIFIVLRKQPLVLLQWYHHCITLCLAWKVLPFEEPIARWYGFLNYGVHSLMYPYFGIRALGFRVPNFVAMTITITQVLQMAIAVFVNFYTYYIVESGGFCMRHPTSLVWSTGVYASFFFLFVKFFIHRYFGKSKQE